jgi:hypothetical protein
MKENIQRKLSSISNKSLYVWMQLYMEVPEMYTKQDSISSIYCNQGKLYF